VIEYARSIDETSLFAHGFTEQRGKKETFEKVTRISHRTIDLRVIRNNQSRFRPEWHLALRRSDVNMTPGHVPNLGT
jgi:hypothetical protein